MPAEPVQPHASALVRALLVCAGTVCVALGVVGIFLPLLPTTPFLLLAAACYARASPRFHRWLLGHKILGAFVRDWHEHRAIPLRAKIVATVLLAASLGFSTWLAVPHPAGKVAMAATGVLVAAWLWTRPTLRR